MEMFANENILDVSFLYIAIDISLADIYINHNLMR